MKELKEIVINDMKICFLPEILRIELASFTMPWPEAQFYNEINKPRSLSKVAIIDNKIVGYICVEQIIDESHILNLAVHPEYRGLNIASTLINYMINYLRDNNCRFIFLEVRNSNEIAKKMYRKFEFKVLGTRKKYYISPVEDAVVMVLRLGE
jgi:ribosomal-protein-alanine N-acetyltransferase